MKTQPVLTLAASVAVAFAPFVVVAPAQAFADPCQAYLSIHAATPEGQAAIERAYADCKNSTQGTGQSTGSQPPDNQPPDNQPPANQPPANQPPANQPPGNPPPGNPPPGNPPPGNPPGGLTNGQAAINPYGQDWIPCAPGAVDYNATTGMCPWAEQPYNGNGTVQGAPPPNSLGAGANAATNIPGLGDAPVPPVNGPQIADNGNQGPSPCTYQSLNPLSSCKPCDQVAYSGGFPSLPLESCDPNVRTNSKGDVVPLNQPESDQD